MSLRQSNNKYGKKSNIISASSPFRSLDIVQILDVQDHLLGLLLCRLSLLLRQLQVSPDHILQRFDVHLEAKTNHLHFDSKQCEST